MGRIIVNILVAAMIVGASIFAGTGIGFAQAPTSKYSATEIYTFFSQYTPRQVMEYTDLGAQHFAQQLQRFANLSKSQEEKAAEEVLRQFHQLQTTFKVGKEPLHPFIVLLRCDEFRIVAHPIPEFFAVMSQKGFIKLYKDVKGKKIGVDLCEKVLQKPQGVWGFQNQWWPQTDLPLSMGVFTMSVPNSNYQVQSYYPTNTYSESDFAAAE